MSRIMLAAVLGLALAGATRADAPFTWKLNTGDQFYVEETAKLRFDLKIGGDTERLAQTLTLVSRMTVLRVDLKGEITVGQEIVAAKMREGENPATSLDVLVGAKFAMTFDRSMNVLRFDGYEELVRKVTGGDPAAEAQFRRQMSADESARRLAETFNLYAGTNAGSDRGWTRTRDLTLGALGTAKMTMNYRNADAETVNGRTLRKATFASTVAFRAGGGENGVRVKDDSLDFTGAGGSVSFDEAAGRLNRIEFKVPLKGVMTITVGGNSMDGTIDGVVEQTIRVMSDYVAE